MKVVREFRLAVALPIVAAGAFLTPQLMTGVQSRVVPRAAAVDYVLVAEPSIQSLARDQADERSESGEANGFVDLYGNDISDAVATYTFDQTGSLYELHSPQTELPRLGSPKS